MRVVKSQIVERLLSMITDMIEELCSRHYYIMYGRLSLFPGLPTVQFCRQKGAREPPLKMSLRPYLVVSAPSAGV